MEIDRQRQAQAKLEVEKRLEQAEKERSRLRLINGLRELEGSNFTILSNDQFVEGLTEYLCEPKPQAEHRRSVISILDQIGSACCHDNRLVRERALVVLSVFSEYVLEHDQLEYVLKLSEILTKWLGEETEYLSGFTIICRQLQKIGVKLLLNRYWDEAEALIVLLNKVENKILKKSNVIRGVVAKIPSGIAAKNVLVLLTDIYLDTSDKDHKKAGRILKILGRKSVVFLLNKLMHSKDKIERFRLMGLIPQSGPVVRPVFAECLDQNPPWYVIRNIVSMISESGDTSQFYLVEDYLGHPDIRVQQEVISCIERLGGIDMKTRMLLALATVCDDLKIDLVLKIGQFTGSDIAATLNDLFERRETFSSSIADELLLMLCLTLRSFPSKRTVQNLKQFVEDRKQNKGALDKIVMTAEGSLAVLEPQVRHQLKGETETLNEISYDSDPFSEHEAKRRIRGFIDGIQDIIANGDIGKASEMLYSKAVAAARNKDFKVAEILRDKILEVNPIALAEVLEVGEIIEEEKSTSISSSHIEIWRGLYEGMSTEECNALYSVIKKEIYSPEEIIVKSGELDPSLFFVNSGVVRLTCMCGNKETFLKRLQAGEIMGVGQFFSLSVWTVSLISQNTTQIHVLERERFKKVKDKFPEIEQKLREYCLQFDTIPELLRMTGGDRREYARYSLPYYISSVTLDPFSRKKQYSLEGETIDISRGGLSFILRMSRGINTKFLLGRQIVSEIHCDPKEKFKCSGMIVGVGFPRPENLEYSIHIKFSSLMKETDFTRFNRAS